MNYEEEIERLNRRNRIEHFFVLGVIIVSIFAFFSIVVILYFKNQIDTL